MASSSPTLAQRQRINEWLWDPSRITSFKDVRHGIKTPLCAGKMTYFSDPIRKHYEKTSLDEPGFSWSIFPLFGLHLDLKYQNPSSELSNSHVTHGSISCQPTTGVSALPDPSAPYHIDEFAWTNWKKNRDDHSGHHLNVSWKRDTNHLYLSALKQTVGPWGFGLGLKVEPEPGVDGTNMNLFAPRLDFGVRHQTADQLVQLNLETVDDLSNLDGKFPLAKPIFSCLKKVDEQSTVGLDVNLRNGSFVAKTDYMPDETSRVALSLGPDSICGYGEKQISEGLAIRGFVGQEKGKMRFGVGFTLDFNGLHQVG